MKENLIDRKIISTIGFPKSGNHWLERLVSQSLNAKILEVNYFSGRLDNNSANNQFLNNPDHQWVVTRTHKLPDDHKMADISKFIYIIRDIRSILVSAFYHVNKVKYNPVKKSPNFFKNPFHFFSYIFWRMKFGKFVNDFCKNETLYHWKKTYGTWDESINKWMAFGKENKDIFSYVRYESLMEDPLSSMRKIFKDLNFDVSENQILKTIEFQDFSNFRKRIKSEGVKQNMRSGKIDDYKFFLTASQESRIKDRFGETMKRYGYL